ncbi:MAG: dTDP-4-dehydrorhamnose 3,5-epimerase [Helicobacteraceae bacterium]|jgi:dTDP-4-dehydrorhamnose 3,5-epimerase|nr:dTDP-4-dehydrorhamnose 3,5-epimerase [Helicobacteraceae bacterium]
MLNKTIIIKSTTIAGFYIGRVKRSSDERGSYSKIFAEAIYKELGFNFTPKEFSVLFSRKGALRGMHFKRGAMGEHPAKIAYCVTGKLCVAGVDIRAVSPTFGKYETVELTAEQGAFVYLREGVAFGTLALEDSHLAYITNQNYGETIEGGFKYDDPQIAIPWPSLST